MNFFKSVFSNDADPPSDADHDPLDHEEGGRQVTSAPDPSAGGASADGGSAWSFGGILKTITTRSETVIQTYKRDLEEFGSGFRKETSAIRDAATRVVLDLPGSLEIGASVAQESLETVGQAIDDFGGSVWRGTTEIISHGKELALLSIDDANAAGDSNSDALTAESIASQSNQSRRYSRFDAQVLAIQSDPLTFTQAPEDVGDFDEWSLGFRLEDKEEEIEGLVYESNALEALFQKLVPSVVDRDTFWNRYFYRVHKLRQAEDARANLVKRVISREAEDEDLSWEVEDDAEDGKEHAKAEEIHEVGDVVGQEKELDGEEKGVEVVAVEAEEEHDVSESLPDEMACLRQLSQGEKLDVAAAMLDDKQNEFEISTSSGYQSIAEGKVEASESSKDSDFSIISSQPSVPEEDDLGWDEIADLGEHDDRNAPTDGGSSFKIDTHKRLSVTEDEDLTWDIED